MMSEGKVSVTENRPHRKPAGRALKSAGQAEEVMAWKIEQSDRKRMGVNQSK